MPDPESNGFVKTLNNMGYMTSTLDPYSEEFVRFAPQAPGPALDIGAAYGVATLAALKAGARVCANDLDPRHLEILFARTPYEQRGRLELKCGSFPDGIEFTTSSLGAVLIARVLHFFDGPAIERSARKLFEWLAAGGKAFIVSETPYLKNFQSFIPIYEKRKRSGDPWPGFVADVMAIAPERGKSLPPRIHFLDPDVLRRIFSQAGFAIEKVGTMPRPDFPEDLRLDGRESVGLIVRKP